ncbi:MAG TPA: hypothetical protein VD866_32310 [Urbifossiella sp.]|nr:hypothetical protein [Urbifossiella sp.]
MPWPPEKPQAPDPTPGAHPFDDVLPWELKCVYDRREQVWVANGAPESPPAEPLPDEPKKELAEVRHDALNMGLVGLALSGGGIRSASTSLGFLQGLGRLRLLRVFDYLSTVSGGGYTGGWFAAWVRREHERVGADKGGLANVERQLDPSRVSEARAVRYHRDEGTVGTEEAKQNTRFQPEVAGQDPKVIDQEPEPVYHVRAYSNFLTPRGGVFSADSWVLAAIYLRNTLINLLIVLLMAAAVVALSRLAVWGYAQGFTPGVIDPMQIGLTGAALALGVLATLVVLRNRAVVGAASARDNRAGTAVPGESSATRVRWLVVLPLVASAALLVWCLSVNPADPNEGLRYAWAELVESTVFPEVKGEQTFLTEYPVVFYAAVAAGVSCFVALMGFVLFGRLGAGGVRVALATTWFGFCLGAFVFLAMNFAIWEWTTSPALLATLGPPLILAAFVLAGFVEQWVFYGFSTYEQEWRSRLAADLMIAAVVWLVFFGSTLYLPGLFDLLSQEVRRYVTGAVVVGWLGTVAGGVFAGRSQGADPTSARPSRVAGILVTVAPPAFLIGVLALLSVGLSAALLRVDGPAADTSPPAGTVAAEKTPANWKGVAVLVTAQNPPPDRFDVHRVSVVVASPDSSPARPDAGCGGLGIGVWVGTAPKHWIILVAVAIGLAVSSAVLSVCADVNVFSMHALYGNRLVRCFLAASRRKEHENPDDMGRPRRSAPFGVRGWYRHANAYTGFDAGDDLPLSDLRPLVRNTNPDGTPAPGYHRKYDGPYPLFGTTLNLIAGQDLAMRDRKGAAFVLTPDFCGSEATGYGRTPDGANGENLTVGRAMTISGAAVDASMPLQSSALRALMTLFNARLGWWMQNPREFGKKWAAASPTGGVLGSLGRELLGRTDDRGWSVHLSDGGHFDNSGVYELVRRRCRFIVALDADTDPNDSPENLAMMVQRVRTDFGVRIEIDTLPLRKDAAGKSKWHVAVGSIRYDEVDPNAVAGTFVFVRASLTGDEPADLRNYAVKDPRFPHHPTFPEQFFDEGQFESYRMLGEHIADIVFGEAAARFDADRLRPMNHDREVRRLFSLVRNRWFPPPMDFTTNYQEAGKAFAELMGSLRADPKMNRLTHDIYPEVARLTNPPFKTDEWEGHDVERAELTAVSHVLDVMQTVWMGMELDGSFSHPLQSGWMGSFRRWAAAATFQKYWPVVRGEYSRDFVRFCERVLNLPAVKVQSVQINTLPAGTWQGMIERLDKEYVAEWAGVLSEIERFEEDRARVHPARHLHVPSPESLTDAVNRAIDENPSGTSQEPLVWFLTLADPPKAVSPNAAQSVAKVSTAPLPPTADKAPEAAPAATVPDLPIGILAVYPVKTNRFGPEPCYEVLFWLRGAYRSIGLGRQAVEARVKSAPGEPLLYEHILLRLAERKPLGCRLIARYPVVGKTIPDRVQRVLWQNFFYDYEFRRVHGDPKGRYLTLEYLLHPDKKRTIEEVIADRVAHHE